MIKFVLRLKWIIVFGLLVSCVNKGPKIETNENALTPNPDTTLQAPDFVLPDPNGEEFKLASYKGDILVLNFWAPWCGYCREELPDFVALQEELLENDVRFVGIATKEQKWEEIHPVAEEYNINFTLLKDDGNFYDKYGPMGVPRTFVINHRGELAYTIKGAITQEEFAPMLKKLIDLAQ